MSGSARKLCLRKCLLFTETKESVARSLDLVFNLHVSFYHYGQQ